MKRMFFIGVLFVLVSFQSGWGYSTREQESSGGLIDIALEIATAPCGLLAACLGMDGSGPSEEECYVVCAPPRYSCGRPPQYVYGRPPARRYTVSVPVGRRPPTDRTVTPRVPRSISAPTPQAGPSAPSTGIPEQIPSHALQPLRETSRTVTRPPQSAKPRPAIPEPLQDAPRKMERMSPPVQPSPQAGRPEPPQGEVVPTPLLERSDKPGQVPPRKAESPAPSTQSTTPAVTQERILKKIPQYADGMAPPRVAEQPEAPEPPKKEKKKTVKKRHRSPCSPCYPRYYGYPGGMYFR